MKTKNWVIYIAFLAIALPFILQTNIYPFFRFGMFAEPIKKQIQKEYFIIKYKSNSGKEDIVGPAHIGMSENNLNYLIRNHFYRNETATLLNKINASTKNQQFKELSLQRIIEKDTTTIFTKKCD